MVKIKGRLAEWNDERGFGFIETILDAKRFFVHVSAFPRGRRPQTGDVIFFEAAKDEKGRAIAMQVQYSTVRKLHSTRRTGSFYSPRSVLAIGHLLVLLVLVLLVKLPAWWLFVVLLMSLLTFLAYRQDKQAAQLGYWRTPENTLQIMSLLGGWSGALLAQLFLRHKSQKQEFLIVFWAAVILNLALSIYFVVKGFPMLEQ